MGQNIWKDGIIGLMVGDALGVPVEFSSREDREHDPVIGMRAYGTHNQPAGTWSDDSSMTLCYFGQYQTKKGKIDYKGYYGQIHGMVSICGLYTIPRGI